MIEPLVTSVLTNALFDFFTKYRREAKDPLEVFISYSSTDKAVADGIAEKLSSLELAVNLDSQIQPGQEWGKQLEDMISRSQIYIVIIPEKFTEWTSLESSMIAAQARQSSDKLLIPVMFRDAEMPGSLAQWQYIMLNKEKLDYGINRIVVTVYEYLLRIQKVSADKIAVSEEINKSAAEYIKDSLKDLSRREIMERRTAYFWQGAGFVLLILGIFFSYLLLKQSEQSLISNQGIGGMMYVTIKSLFVIALIIASVKYSFDLAKAHMNESLKNADRIHAISFGEFYLRAFGEKANWDEIKEVFQHWNITSDSYFTKLDSKNYDPALIDKAIDLIKSANDKK